MDCQNMSSEPEVEVDEGVLSLYNDEELEGRGFVWGHDRPHPLCIPHIVDNILSYLDIPELRTSRLVNSQYNEIACLNLERKEVITFNKMSHLSSYLDLMMMPTATIAQLLDEKDNKNRAIKKARKYLDDDDNTTTTAKILVHSNFHFNFDPEDTDPEVEVKLLSFFDNVGHQIVELRYTTDLIPLNFPKRLPHIGDIWMGRLHNLETICLEIKWGCPATLFEKDGHHVVLPSVKKLVLDILVTEREAERASLFLAQLISATPNLEEISIPGNKRFFDDYINVVLGRLLLTMDLPRLSTLNFCLAFNPSQMWELAMKNFPLKSLILDFAEIHHFAFPNQNPLLERSLQLLFAQTASTLQYLHLCFPYNSEHPMHRFITFPEPMTQLKYLALGRYHGSVSILNNLPVIKKLDLWSVRFHDFDYGGPENCKEGLAVPTKYLGITTVIS